MLKKTRRKRLVEHNKNALNCLEQILKAPPHKTVTVQPLNYVSKTISKSIFSPKFKRVYLNILCDPVF